MSNMLNGLTNSIISIGDNMKGKLICFEGSDKTGKTSVAKMLCQFLNDNNISCTFTFQPGDSNYGQLAPIIRSFCLDKRWDLHELTNFFIFFADKVEQVDKVIKPALERGHVVITDRWWYSTDAYQFHGKQLKEKYDIRSEIQDWLNHNSVLNVEPDITMYFPETLDITSVDDDKNDQFETADDNFKNRVHLAYERLAKKNRFIRIKPGRNVYDTTYKVIHKLINIYGENQ